jgi:hypothetical protein
MRMYMVTLVDQRACFLLVVWKQLVHHVEKHIAQTLNGQQRVKALPPYTRYTLARMELGINALKQTDAGTATGTGTDTGSETAGPAAREKERVARCLGIGIGIGSFLASSTATATAKVAAISQAVETYYT